MPEIGPRYTSQTRLTNKSRVYADVLVNRPAEYFTHNVIRGNTEDLRDYQRILRLGDGAFGTVFSSTRKVDDQSVPCALKIFDVEYKQEVIDEVRFLTHLRGGDRIINFFAVATDYELRKIAIIFDMPCRQTLKDLWLEDSFDYRFYMFQLLEGLNFCHSRGVMHRDIKPENILIDISREQLWIIDFGLASFYFPNKAQSAYVGTLYWRAPELSIGYKYSNYSVDVWSMGCILATMVFKRYPFFYASTVEDHLVCIANLLGTASLDQFLTNYGIVIDNHLRNELGKPKAMNLLIYVNEDNKKRATCAARNLIESLLVYDHNARLTAKEAMEHVFFVKVWPSHIRQPTPKKLVNIARKMSRQQVVARREPRRNCFLL